MRRNTSSYLAENAMSNDEERFADVNSENKYSIDSAKYEIETPKYEAPVDAAAEASENAKTESSESETTPEISGATTVIKKEELTTEKPAVENAEASEAKLKKSSSGEFKPLWERNPGKYRKKRPLFVRFLGGLWSFFFFWALTAGMIGVLILGAGVTLLYSFTDPELDATLANLEIASTSQILAYNSEGELVVYEELHSSENRVWLSINEMPQHLLDITVAVEDKRFYDHMGFDPIRTVSATIQYVLNKIKGGDGVGDGGGGSTLTQQVIKNITQDKETDGWAGIVRKFKEILRAFYIERKYDKDQILEYYLNIAHFGNGCDGMYTAAKYYFDKDVSDLTMSECAAILSITNNPSVFDPYINPDSNYERRTIALWNAWDQEYISEEEYRAAVNEPLILRDRNASSSTSSNSSVRSYFTDLVFEWTINELMEQKGFTRSGAINYIYTAGLRIYTTIDPEIQQIMETYFSNEENYIDKDAEIKAEIAMEIIDPSTGNILGIIGGRGEKTGSLTLNRVSQTVRQPGSAIKPISVYGYAIENNIITAASAIDDSPLYVEPKENKVSKEDYDLEGLIYTSYTSWPVNYDRKYNGILDVKAALHNSYNTPAVKVLQMIGVEESFNFAKNMMRLESLVDADKNLAPLSVGSLTYGVTLQELTAAYTVYANQGSYSAPRCVTRIETFDGKVILENDVDRSIVFTPQTSYIMTDILMKAVSNGSSSDVANLSPIATAGKSGTTSSFKDRWFIGYTPYYLAGIWWGYDIPQSNENTHHIQMWHDVMLQVHSIKGITEGEFVQPDGIVTATYCNISGKAPGPYCSTDPRGSRVRTGLFKNGTQPTETCDVHHQLYVCSESGQIAHENCPSAYLATFIDVARSYENMYVKIKDAEYVCPPLDSNQILYNSSVLPAYTYMIPEGEYPCLPQTSKSKYANCICQTHTASATPHYYTYKFTHTDDSSRIEDIIFPEDLITPEELETQRLEEQFLEVAIQVYDLTQTLIEGLSEEQFVEIVKHVYDTTETVMENITPEQYLELAKHVYDTKTIVMEGLTPEQMLELAKHVYQEHKVLLEGYTEEMVAPQEEEGQTWVIPDLPIIFP
ncbi:MAG: penicillin-binding protein [Clostridia bacterium]|nr:penicillin-binding protein [Clostridia bacterium]